MSMSRDRAEVIALQAVRWLASDGDLLAVFLGATGATEQDFRQGIKNEEFLGSVLDFILMDDAWIGRFCEASEMPMEAPSQARMALAGGAQVHWT